MPDKPDTTEKRSTSSNNQPQENGWVEIAEALLLPPLVGIGQAAVTGAMKGAVDAAQRAQSKPPAEKEKDKSQSPEEKAKEKAQPPKVSALDVSDVVVAGFCAAAPIACLPLEVANEVVKESVKQSMRAIDMVIDGKPKCKAPQTAEDVMNEILSVPTDVYNYFKNKPLKATTEFMLFPPIGVVNAKLDKCTF